MGIDPTPLNLPKKTNYKPVLLTILCSFLLGAGSCFGFLTTLNFNRSVPINGVFAVAFPVSLIWLIVTIVINFFRRGTEGQ